MDCEFIRDVIGQPANVVSSLAMSAMGLWLLVRARAWPTAERRRSLALVGWSLVSTGIGSAAFHGPGGWSAHVLHDVTITALPVAAAVALEAERRNIDLVRWFGAVMAVVVLARMAHPLTHYPLTALAFGWLGYAVVHRRPLVRAGWLAAAALCLVLARVFFQLSRTGQVLCNPESLLQGHAAWHLLAGVGVVLVAKGLSMVPPRDIGSNIYSVRGLR